MIIGFIRDYKERGERFNLEGVKVIKRAKSEVQAKKTVNGSFKLLEFIGGFLEYKYFLFKISSLGKQVL